MVSKEPSRLLPGQTNSKTTLADKLPATMTVRSVLLNRDSPDIESRLKKRRNRTHQVRFKDLEDGSSSSGNSGTGENHSNQRTSTDCSSPHPVRKHVSRTPLPWADEPQISSLPGQTSVVGAVRGDMASTIEVVAAFLARAPPHPLTPGPTRRCWTPPQANSLTLPMTRKPSTSTAIQTSPCLKKPLSTHTRSHSLGDSVGIDGDDEHDSQDENFFHNHMLAHRPKDHNGTSGCTERNTIERRSKSRTEMKSAVTVVKNSRHISPLSVCNSEPCHCSTVSSQVGPKRPGSSTPSLVRRRKRFSRTTSDPGKEVHYCTTPTQTESRSLSPPPLNTKLCTTHVQTEGPSKNPGTVKSSSTQSQAERHSQSSPVNRSTLPPNHRLGATKTKSSCRHSPAPSVEHCATQSQSKSLCASEVLPTSSVDTLLIRAENLDSSFAKDRDSISNKTVPYSFDQLSSCLPTHVSLNSTNMACFSVNKPICSFSGTPCETPGPCSTATTLDSASPVLAQQSAIKESVTNSVASVVTPQSATRAASHCSDIKGSTAVSPYSASTVVTAPPSVVTTHSGTPNLTTCSVATVETPLSIAPNLTTHPMATVDISHSVSPEVKTFSIPTVYMPNSTAPKTTTNSIVSVAKPHSIGPNIATHPMATVDMPHSIAPDLATNSMATVAKPNSVAPNVTTCSMAIVDMPHSIAPNVKTCPMAAVAKPHSLASDLTTHPMSSVDMPYSTAPNLTIHSMSNVEIPHSLVTNITTHSMASVDTPNSIDPILKTHPKVAVAKPHSVASNVKTCPMAAFDMPHSIAPDLTTHPMATVDMPHSIAPDLTTHPMATVDMPRSIGPDLTMHPMASVDVLVSEGPRVTLVSATPTFSSPTPDVSALPIPNCSVMSPSDVILPVFSCSASLSMIQDCTTQVSNIDPPLLLTCSAPSPVPRNSPIASPNVSDMTRHIPTPVNVISLLPNVTSPTNVAPCTFVTQTAISCTSISYYTTSHPVGPTGPQSHILPPAYATLVQTVSHCNIPCQVLQNTVSSKITPFSSPVPKLKSCTTQPILVKTYTSSLPIMQQCVTPTKTAPLYSSTFRAAPPYTPPCQTQVKRGVRLPPPPPPPPPPYTPRKNKDQPTSQISVLRTDNKTTEKEKNEGKDIKEDVKCKDTPKRSGKSSSLKHRAQTPPMALMKSSPAKACFKSSCLNSAHAQLGVLHKMLCSGARPRPNTPCQFPLPQNQQGRCRVRRCSVPTERSTAGPLTPAQADTLRQVQEILGGLMSGAKCKLDPAKVTERLLSPNGPLRDIRSLQTQLQSLEGVLETSQNTIKILLDVIQDLEKKEAVKDGRHLYRTGQDIENCGTCRDCACIIYSVEHDFRLQEGQVVRTWKVGDPPEERPQTPTPPPSTPLQQDSPQAVRPPVCKKNRKKCFWFL